MAAHVMIHIKPEDLPPEGLRVRYRYGENYEGQIEWGDIQKGLLINHPECNDLKEPGLNINDCSTPGYAGFEQRTGNYWRYLHESDPEVFREQCLQVIEILEPFTPLSSWRAWEAVTESVGSDRLRLTIKNRVTSAELSYKIINKGFGYQIKDLSNGRRVQKLLKHDYMLNQLLGTSYKKLNHHKIRVSTEEAGGEAVGGSISLHFLDEGLKLKYRISDYDFGLSLYKTSDKETLIKQVDLPHSQVIEDTKSFLG